MEIYAAPKLSKYMTALGAYNVKSFTYEINQHMHVRALACAHARTYTRMHTHACTHTHTHTHTHMLTSMLTHARTHKQVVRNLY